MKARRVRLPHLSTLQRLLLLAGVICLALLGATVAGLRLNTTTSVPRGFYRLSHHPAHVGDFVALCPPDREPFITAKTRGYLGGGPCPGQYRVMFKVLVAQAGDRVAIAADGVRINGHGPLLASRPVRADRRGAPLPDLRGFSRPLTGPEVFVMSQRAESGFDGRYFGPLPRQAILGRLDPLWLW